LDSDWPGCCQSQRNIARKALRIASMRVILARHDQFGIARTSSEAAEKAIRRIDAQVVRAIDERIQRLGLVQTVAGGHGIRRAPTLTAQPAKGDDERRPRGVFSGVRISR